MKQDHRFAKSWLTQSEPGIGRHADSKSRERIGNPDELTFSDTVGSRALQAFNHVFDRHQTTCLDLARYPDTQCLLLWTGEPRPDGLRQQCMGLDSAPAFRIAPEIATELVQPVGSFFSDCSRGGERARQTRDVRYFPQILTEVYREVARRGVIHELQAPLRYAQFQTIRKLDVEQMPKILGEFRERALGGGSQPCPRMAQVPGQEPFPRQRFTACGHPTDGKQNIGRHLVTVVLEYWPELVARIQKIRRIDERPKVTSY